MDENDTADILVIVHAQEFVVRNEKLNKKM